MKSIVKYLAVGLCATVIVSSASAQTMKSVLSSVKSGLSKVSQSNNSCSSSLARSVSSSKKVSIKSLVATWSYKEPAIDFESGSLVGKISGTVAGNKLEDEIASKLSEAGFKAGDFKITFNSDSTFTSTLKGKTATGRYTLSGSTITFSRSATSAQKVSAAIKVSSSTMQITFKADKLLSFIQEVSNAAGSTNSTLKAISTLSKSYKGMNVGLSFTKSK